MKKLVAILAVLALVNMSSRTSAADGTINLTNYDSNNPIFYAPTHINPVLLPVANSFVQMLGGPVGGSMVVLSSPAGSANIFPLVEPGFFDRGFGSVPGVPEGAQGQFQVRAWRGAATYDAASERGASVTWVQAVGAAFPGNPPLPASNRMPAGITVTPLIPEPSVMILGLLGATVLFFRRRR